MNSSPNTTTELDLDFVRAQFPAFSHPDTGQWAHLENAGGSYVPSQVVDLLADLFAHNKCQPGWTFGPSTAAAEAMEHSRRVMATLFNAEPGEIHFGPSTSQNTYVLARAMRPLWSEGDEIIVTDQDHEANSGVWRLLAETGIVVKEWKVDPATGLLDPASAGELITERTRPWRSVIVPMWRPPSTRSPISPHGSMPSAGESWWTGSPLLPTPWSTFGPSVAMSTSTAPTRRSVPTSA